MSLLYHLVWAARILNKLLDNNHSVVAGETTGCARDVVGCVFDDVAEPGLMVEWEPILDPLGMLNWRAIDLVLEFYGRPRVYVS